MGSVAVGAMVVGTSLLVVFALAMATLESQVEDSIAQIEATAEPIAKFSIQNANNVCVVCVFACLPACVRANLPA